MSASSVSAFGVELTASGSSVGAGLAHWLVPGYPGPDPGSSVCLIRISSIARIRNALIRRIY